MGHRIFRAIGLIVVCAAVLGTGCPTPVQGNPMLYTFEGVIAQVRDGTRVALGLVPGSPVTYSVVVDFDSHAYTVDNGNNKVYLTDGVAVANFPAGLDYFYTSFEAGALIDEVNGGVFNGPNDVKEFHLGADGDPAFPGQIIVGSNDHSLVLASDATQVNEWDVGTLVDSAEESYDDQGAMTSIFCLDLELTSITPYTP